MDIKEQVEKVLKAIGGNQDLIAQFKKDPIALVKKYIGDAIPADVIDKIVAGVKAKLTADKASGVVEALGGLFKK